MNRRGKEIHLQKLRNPHCTRCGLYKSSKHVCILGRGNVMAPIFLIGEAPGPNEEKTGKPFTGRAGKFLDKILKLLEMFHLVYITNADRCRPPGNRNPTPVEITACRYYLDKEISIVKPKVIILLGRIATTAMGFGADVHAGSEAFLFDEIWWIKCTWHPSYCLRRGKGATKDLTRALKWAKEKVSE